MAVLSELEIYNMACSAVTTTSRIASTAEQSKEAKECALWYPSARNLVLSAAMWPSTTKTARLALVATRDEDEDWAEGDPLPSFLYAYARPSDMLRPRYLANYARFTMGLAGATPVLMSNQVTPLLIYTMRQENPSLWDDDLQLAVIHTLASKIARQLTGSRTKQIDNFTMANDLVLTARANAANQRQGTVEYVSDSLVARGASNLGPPTPYLYPDAEFSLVGFGNVG